MQQAISKARELAAMFEVPVTVSEWEGSATGEKAVRISGCLFSEAVAFGQKLAKAIGGKMNASSGFVAVWI